ncbi:Secreted protein containing DUF1552 OS=Rhodopirellula europaea SH398 GN=RESH_04023 PE=4 SV=1: HXXSHH [Gemmataceae bacterium]|nr:Secreted protein containing DUF1552 OS=Rhodopirellula europaea SH398 GN=RESH_04023 PE=4 SV=1: HXXSHH [Gemmataceae bacterium]VTU02550.1 Secreted protein containing DUF1552 OS=Rhodopirellula europaea SH398 GN=RESH_04023 PE=4 SV=1: HXXSHH [Gemmataceae bacterium]
MTRSASSAPTRRRFLRAAAGFLALPAVGRAADREPPRRLLAIHVPLGMMPQFFFPKRGEATSPYLDLLAAHRPAFTTFSGLSHPGVDGNHHAGQCFLTSAPHPGQPTFRNSISLDQLAADRIGGDTRFPSLAVSVRQGEHYADSVAVARSGVPLPAETSAEKLYQRLFVPGTPADRAAALRRLEAGGSVLDLNLEKARAVTRGAAGEDRERLDQYFQSVRELEARLRRSAEWEARPKPAVDYPPPRDVGDANQVIAKSKLMFDLIRLALQTDSTRVVTLSLSTFSVVPHVPGVKSETHGLTHHGNDPDKVAELRKIEEAQVTAFGGLLAALGAVKEAGGSLLDRTQVLYGSCMGNANSHSNRNLPVILAGGGFKHGRHLAFDEANNTPLTNLFVSVLRHLGVETDRFASSTGPLRGLTW